MLRPGCFCGYLSHRREAIVCACDEKILRGFRGGASRGADDDRWIELDAVIEWQRLVARGRAVPNLLGIALVIAGAMPFRSRQSGGENKWKATWCQRHQALVGLPWFSRSTDV